MEDIDRIEAYLAGTMTGSERQAFEAEVAAKPALAEEVDAVRLAREAVELSIGDQLRTQFEHWQATDTAENSEQEAPVIKMHPRRNLRHLLAIAAGVLLVLAVGSFWYANDQFSADRLAMSYYEEIPMDLYVRGAANPMAEAVDAMQTGNFTEADAYFRSIPASDDQYYDARYYLAHSLYRQGDYNGSIATLNILDEATNRNLREDSQWLKLLNQLELGETESTEFQDLLAGIITDEGHTHHEDAVILDRKLKSFWYNIAN